jgi:CSLREA domain-containing protein
MRISRWLAACLVAALAPAAGALDLAVSTTADAVDALPGDGLCADAASRCTLRAAIQEANATAGADTIRLSAGRYVLALAGAGEDAGATGDLDILEGVRIEGVGPAETVVDAAGLDGVFHLVGSSSPPAERTVSLAKLRVTGGVDGISAGSSWTLSLEDAAVSGNAGTGVLFQLGPGAVSLARSRVSRNAAGGIRSPIFVNVLVDESRLDDNGGRAIAGGDSGVVVVTRSKLRRNAGGIASNDTQIVLTDSLVAENQAPDAGGGIFASLFVGVTIAGSTLAGNSAPSGGALFVGNSCSFEVANGTISGNRAERGGAIFLTEDAGLGTLRNATVTGNEAADGGGLVTGRPIQARNSIVAGNRAAQGPDCSSPGSGATVLALQGHNLIGDASGCTLFVETPPAPGDQVGDAAAPLDPHLAELRRSGGPTPTHALRPGSPALEAGSPEEPGSTERACEPADQRGVPRPQDFDGDGEARCDIGAYEAEPPTPGDQIREILDFFDESVAAGELVGTGGGKSSLRRLRTFRMLLQVAAIAIERGSERAACALARTAERLSDGKRRPPDFVEGPAADELARLLGELQESLGCRERPGPCRHRECRRGSLASG